jgi:hypothetical protein
LAGAFQYAKTRGVKLGGPELAQVPDAAAKAIGANADPQAWNSRLVT